MKAFKLNFLLVAVFATISASAFAAGQPHMRNALEHLRAARAELRTAEHNKAAGGIAPSTP